MKLLYHLTGVDNKTTVFLFSDVQALEKSFFEDINCILGSGEVANLYKIEELEEASPLFCNNVIYCHHQASTASLSGGGVIQRLHLLSLAQADWVYLMVVSVHFYKIEGWYTPP